MSNEPGAEKSPLKHETGTLDAVKGRTDEENTDPVRVCQPNTPAGEASIRARAARSRGVLKNNPS
jgi:hypothetical protein